MNGCQRLSRLWIGLLGVGLLGPMLGEAAGQDGFSPLFPDAALESAVRSQIFAKRQNREPLVEADLLSVSSVIAKGAGIRDLTGLERCRHLAMLDLAGNRIEDLTALAGLRRLQYLDVRSNRVVAVVPLRGLGALQYLDLGWNHLADAGPLRGLTNLSTLMLEGNRLSDLSAFTGLVGLKTLYLDDNRIPSLEGIEPLKGLVTLSVSGNRITDLGPLVALPGLRQVYLERNRIRDLTLLQVWLENEPMKSVAPFLEIRTGGNPLSSEARRRQIPALRKGGILLESTQTAP